MRILIISVLLVFTQLTAFSNPHSEISLNGEWKFIVDSLNSGQKNGYANALPEIARTIRVPHTWNIDPGTESYYGLAWYQKDFTVSGDLKGKAIYIKFGAVYHDAVVFLNGQKIGEHLNSGYTSFEFDISKQLIYGGLNRLVVSVNNSFSENNLPYLRAYDWTNDGGITRDVSLQISNRPSIKYVHISPDLNVYDSMGKIGVSIKLNEEDVQKSSFLLTCREKKSGKIIFEQKSIIQKSKGVFPIEFDCGTIIPWHFDAPFLYQLDVVALDKNKETDSKTSNFGFRKIELNGEKLFLNGEQVRLPGIEYMPMSHPDYGALEPLAILDSAIRMMKDLNVVITRFHWQQDDAILDLMDEYGILVQEEMPWWQQPSQLSPQLLVTAKLQLSEMIEEHYNHPSLFAWGISNEVFDTRKEDDFQLKAFIHSLDSTRLITIVGNEIHKNLQNDHSLLGDLPTWNEYSDTWFGKKREELPLMLENIHSILNNRPLLITEYGLCEPAFAGGDARRIEDMFFHIREWRSKPFIIGYIYFCLNDYRTQMGEEGIGKYKIRRHGLTDIYLKPKASYAVFKQICSPVEIYKVAKLNESDITVGISVKNTIPSYTIKNYELKYKTMSGTEQKIQIPTLKPDEKVELILKDINASYSFEIVRATGFGVVGY